MSKGKYSVPHKVTILVVEDSRTQAEQLKYLLEQKDYRVIMASNGKQAITLLDENSPDLVITDIIMPEMDGYELCTYIKAEESTQDIPVILLTSLTDSEDVLAGLACGADNFITKPYSEDYLFSNIEKILASKKLHKGERVRIGVEIMFMGKRRFITADQQQMLSLLISSYEAAVYRNAELIKTQDELKTLNEQLENLVEKRTAALSKEIEERVHGEEIIKGVKQRQKAILDNIPDIAWLKDEKSRFIIVNEALGKACGIEPEDIKGKTDLDIWPAELAERYIVDDREVMKSGKRKIVEEPLSGADGQIIWIETIKTPIYDAGGKIIGTAGIARNVTDRKLAEEQIREYSQNLERMVAERTEELKRALFESQEARDRIDWILKSVADGLIVTDLHNQVILMNRAAEDLLGVRLSDVINRSIDYAMIDKTLRERIRTTLKKREQGYQFDFELTGDDSDHPRSMRARTSVIEDKDGKHTGIITIIHDVTYERELDRMKTDFLSTAAHELRSPLTSIEGFSELLMSRDDLTDDERGRFLSHINRQSRNLAAIISDLLDISRIESGRGFTLNKVPSDMEKIVRSAASYFESVSAAHEFAMDFLEEPTELVIDPDKMEQVMSNIFSNAVKYSPRGGVIRVTGTVSGDHYQVSIEDEGMGMTPDQVEKIFDKFYRADSSASAVSGTGLGMSIVKHIVEVHGGTVSVESEPGKGTTVRFAVPTKVR